jgi:hypothetical protein
MSYNFRWIANQDNHPFKFTSLVRRVWRYQRVQFKYLKSLTFVPWEYYTFIACWWGKYENIFTQEYHIPRGQRPRRIWYLWVNKFSYFLNPHAINVLLYRMKPKKHIHVKYCWQTYFKSIGTLSQTFKNHIHNKVMRS